MPDSMIGMIAGTIRMVPIIGQTVILIEVAEAANKIGVAVEVLDVEIIIIIIIMVEAIINKIMAIKIKHQVNIRVIIMIRTEHSSYQAQQYQLSHLNIKIIRPEGLRHQSMQGNCISTISYKMSTAVHGALGATTLRDRVVEDIETRRRLLQ